MSYSTTSRKTFDIKDVDDSTFLNHPRQGSSGYILSDNPIVQIEDKRRQILEERRQIEERTLQSTQNSLSLIYETEKVGLQTAEELLHQREQLENVNDKLDSINQIMRVSQKHLTSMKSIFGGFKNYFSKNAETNPNNKVPQSNKKISSSVSDNKLQHTIESLRTDTSQVRHPKVRDFDYDSANNTGGVDNSNRKMSAYELHSSEIDRKLDNNLEEMGQGISRLKNLALGLGNEIDSQNQMLDTLATKSEKAQDTVANQNRQMKRILKS